MLFRYCTSAVLWLRVWGTGVCTALIVCMHGMDAWQTLDLSYNGIGQASTPALCRFLYRNTNVTHLDLSHNGIPRACFQALHEASNHNYSIRGLHMSGAFHSVHV